MLWDYLVHSPTKNVLSPQTFVDIQDLLKIKNYYKQNIILLLG